MGGGQGDGHGGWSWGMAIRGVALGGTVAGE